MTMITKAEKIHRGGYHPTDRFSNENNDCVVNALSNVTGLPYPVCHAYLKAAGRLDKKGFYTYRHFGEKKDALGFRFAYIDTWKENGNRRMTLARFARRFPNGKFLVCISRHALCVRDGIILDSARLKPNARVRSAWRVMNLGDPFAPAPTVVAIDPVVAPASPAKAPRTRRPAPITFPMRKVARGHFKTGRTIWITRNGSTRQYVADLEIFYTGDKSWAWTLSAPDANFFERAIQNLRRMNQVQLLFVEDSARLRNWTFEPGIGWLAGQK